MIKKLIATLVIIISASTSVMAANTSAPQPVLLGIRKYQQKNYTGCVQSLQDYVVKDKTNQLAYYYLAMAYSKLGDTVKAKSNYKSVVNLDKKSVLANYSNKAIVCIDSPSDCWRNQENQRFANDLEKVVKGPSNNEDYKNLKNTVRKERLEQLRKDINNGEEINNYEFNSFPDYTKRRSDASVKTENKIADSKPTNDEIVAAMKVLNAAGVNMPQQQTNAQTSAPKQQDLQQQQQLATMMQMYQKPDVSMLLGGNSNQNNNNSFMNMLPMILAQQQNNTNGQYNQTNGLSPDVLQALMFNSMMPDLGISDYSNNKY